MTGIWIKIQTGGGVAETIVAACPIGGETEPAADRLFDGERCAAFCAEIIFRADCLVKSGGNARPFCRAENFAGVAVDDGERSSSGGFVERNE